MLHRRSPFLVPGLAIGLAIGLGGCVTVTAAGDHITPRQAIVAAADAAPAGVQGVFEVQVRAVGRSQDRVILNSEADYRDQRNLSIVLSPGAVHAMEANCRGSVEACFQGRKVLVSGKAKRVTIWFFSNGEQTDKYYYQTHVDVADADQVKLLD